MILFIPKEISQFYSNILHIICFLKEHPWSMNISIDFLDQSNAKKELELFDPGLLDLHVD